MTQGEALAILKTGANVFLTGEPGSGKTHVINEFIGWLRASGIEPSVTAATGIAATHVAGMTLHAWSGIGVAETLSDVDVDHIASKEPVARRVGKASILIIEEVSMLSASVFELADRICRNIRRDDRPFGGLTVILVGDFFQLPPVSRAAGTEFAYASTLWRDLNLLTCYLTEQYRQDDAEFLDILSAIRSGTVGNTHREMLRARFVSLAAFPSDLPKLFSHNADVDRINAQELEKLPGTPRAFLMDAKGRETLVNGLKRGCLSPEYLELKEGAAVMFTKNSPQGRFVNGTLGTVRGFDKEGLPLVETRTGSEIVAERMEWVLEEQGVIRASITQVPLRLAYAMTVHKSQGMSMDAAVIDLSRAFEYGQGYVALSRVRRLSGIYLAGLNERALLVNPVILQKDREFRAASEAVRETFAEMPEPEVRKLHEAFVRSLGGAIVRPESEEGSASGDVNLSGDSAAIPLRLARTLQAVRDGETLSSIARMRLLTASTVVKHLEELAMLGKLSRKDFFHLLPDQAAAEKIRTALAAQNGGKLSPVFHALAGRYSFETIRLVRLAFSIDGLPLSQGALA